MATAPTLWDGDWDYPRMLVGKYAIVRTAPSLDPADYRARAESLGLTGLIFKLNDKDSLLAEWLPSATGADWQKLQYMLGPGGGVDVIRGVPWYEHRGANGYDCMLGVMFDAGRGAYEVPQAEGTSWAAIMRRLDLGGHKIDFYMADISVEPRFGVFTQVPQHDLEPYGISAKSLCVLIASARWATTGRPRPCFVITPPVDMETWPGVMWDGYGPRGGWLDPLNLGPRVFAPSFEWNCVPVVAGAHRIDPARGTSDISTGWTWHPTRMAGYPYRGEAVFDLRATSCDGEMLKGLIAYAEAYHEVTLRNMPYVGGAPGTCTWQMVSGLIVFDDLDAIESTPAFTQAVRESADPSAFSTFDASCIHAAGDAYDSLIVWPIETSGQTPGVD